MKSWRALAALVTLAATGAVAADVRYLSLGDSFSIGTGSSEKEAFPSRLKALLEKSGASVKLLNPAVNGYSTQELIDEELPTVKAFRPTLVTLAVGANDLVRGRGPEAYRAQLRRIFAALRADGVDLGAVIALPQPDWSRSPVASAFGQPDELRAKIQAYNAILEAEARAAGARYADLWPLMSSQALAAKVAPDGLHPSATAHAEWAEALFKVLAVPPKAKRDARVP